MLQLLEKRQLGHGIVKPSLRSGRPDLFMRLVLEVDGRRAKGRIEGGMYAAVFVFTL